MESGEDVALHGRGGFTDFCSLDDFKINLLMLGLGQNPGNNLYYASSVDDVPLEFYKESSQHQGGMALTI